MDEIAERVSHEYSQEQMDMRRISIDEVQRIPKGSLILVRWLDANEDRCKLDEHESNPEVSCKDWGLYLGVSGRKHRMLLLGKDVVEVHNEWGAVRIPLDLVEEVLVILPRDDMVNVIKEVGTLGRRIRLRRYKRKEERHSVYTK